MQNQTILPNMLIEELQLVTQPENLYKNLYQHQLSTIYKMEKLESEKLVEFDDYVKETCMAINGNITGYGKTLEMIGLIVRDKMEWDITTPYVFQDINSYNSGFTKKIVTKFYDKKNTTLILISSSILHQWEEELCYAPNLNVLTVKSIRDFDQAELEHYDVILIVATMFNSFISRYENIAWKRFIFDEPGHLKVPAMKKIMAGFYWFVTATPYEIFDRHIKCTSSFMRILFNGYHRHERENLLEGIVIKNSLEFIQRSFNMPQTMHFYYNCYQPIAKMVRGLINDNIITMIKAGNIFGAISALGGQKTENILELIKKKKLVDLEEINGKIRINNMKLDITSEEAHPTDYKNLTEKIAELESLKIEIEKQLEQLDKRVIEMLQSSCNICLDPIENPVMEPSCQNMFCAKCLLEWLSTKRSCPLCRNIINTEELIYMVKNNNNTNNSVKEERNLTKEEQTIQIINNSENGKFLLFSKYDVTFEILCKSLRENNITFCDIKGSNTVRYNNIKKFKNGEIKVMFLNSTVNAAGINLQEATDIILYHEMNEDTETQILGRANRIGRTIPLKVHHFKV